MGDNFWICVGESQAGCCLFLLVGHVKYAIHAVQVAGSVPKELR